MSMFERFTQRARQVIVLAQDEARALRHDHIDTEHLLLGLLREDEGLAARVLKSLDITVEEARAQVARTVGQGDKVTSGQIPFSPKAKQVLELALREGLTLGHNYIGTEHILLGLVRENEGIAARILLDFDADAGKIRREILRRLSRPSRPETPEAAAPAPVRGVDLQRRKWEYRVERWPAGDLSTPVRLDALGAEGWSLAGVLRDGDEVQLIFSRIVRPMPG